MPKGLDRSRSIAPWLLPAVATLFGLVCVGTRRDGGSPSPEPDMLPRAPAGLGPKQYAINLGPNTDWCPDGAWVDARHSFRRWGDPRKPWIERPALRLGPTGYPLEDAGTLSHLRGYPDGAYALSYMGRARVTVGGMGRLASDFVLVGGRWRATVLVEHARSDLLLIRVESVDPDDPIDDLRLIRPRYPPDGPEVFDRGFLARLRPFSSIRVMEWTGANTSNQRKWSDRVPPSAFLSTGPKGVAFEEMFALANEAGKDLWITVPDGADDDFVARLARLARDRLDRRLRVDLELGNELWNRSFPQASRAIAAARLDRSLTRTDDFRRTGEWAAKRLSEVAAIFRREFVPEAARVRPILCGQVANTEFLASGLAYLRATRTVPSSAVSAIAVAPYVGLGSVTERDVLSRDEVFARMERFLEGDLTSWIASHADLAARCGLPLIAYEGGQHLVPRGAASLRSSDLALMRSAQADPRMAAIYRSLDRVWQRAGGGLFCYYSLSSAYGPSGFWGLLDEGGATSSVKYDAVSALAGSPSDAP